MSDYNLGEGISDAGESIGQGLCLIACALALGVFMYSCALIDVARIEAEQVDIPVPEAE